jgi:hypothetical protein
MPFHLQREHLLTEDTPSTPLVTELANWIWLASRSVPSRLTLPPCANIHTLAVFNLALSNAFLPSCVLFQFVIGATHGSTNRQRT